MTEELTGENRRMQGCKSNKSRRTRNKYERVDVWEQKNIKVLK